MTNYNITYNITKHLYINCIMDLKLIGFTNQITKYEMMQVFWSRKVMMQT